MNTLIYFLYILSLKTVTARKLPGQCCKVHVRRRATLLSIPINGTSTFNKRFTASTPRLWNDLPDHVRVYKFGLKEMFWASCGNSGFAMCNTDLVAV